MATPEEEWKHIQRRLRTIPVEEVAPRVAAEERDGLWCLVANELQFIPANGDACDSDWDDFLEHAQFVRWVRAHPDRIHTTREAALAFVQRWFGRKNSA
jgi:GrpB-like predicted nucleotidyltransferase (UPF0157 family)